MKMQIEASLPPNQDEEVLQALTVMVAQAQDSTRLEDRERVEENEGGGVHLPIGRAALNTEQKNILGTALRYFQEAAPRYVRDDAGHAEVEHLGRTWLVEGWLTRKETARLGEVLQDLHSLYQNHIQQENALPHVVIVGGGFGGLYAARELAHAPVRVTMVDRHNYHLFRPMLYQAATGLLAAEEVAPPIRSVLHGQENIDVLLGEVTGVDTGHKRVLMGRESLPYDYRKNRKAPRFIYGDIRFHAFPKA